MIFLIISAINSLIGLTIYNYSIAKFHAVFCMALWLLAWIEINFLTFHLTMMKASYIFQYDAILSVPWLSVVQNWKRTV
jgi:uncharacterized membrane protein YcaP (DUF421 family)